MNLNKLIVSLINKSETIEGILQSGDTKYTVDRVEIVQDRKSIKGINFLNDGNVVYELEIEDINMLYTTIDYIGKTDEIPYNSRVSFKINDSQEVELYADISYISKGFDKKQDTDNLFTRMVNGGIQ